MLFLSFFRGSQSESSQGTNSAWEKKEPNMSVDVLTCFGSSSECTQSVSLAKPSQLPGVRRQVVEALLKKTLDKKFLDICAIDKLIELVGSRQSGDAYLMLNSLHCVHFDSMGDELRSRIPMLINEVLNQQSPTKEVISQILDGVHIE